MRIEMDLPEDLAKKVQCYLDEHPEEDLNSFIKEALEMKLLPQDTASLLEMAGLGLDKDFSFDLSSSGSMFGE
ncbi:hypothetical protein Pse7367_1494 [Thalassoporum mexicanum PCC 7367]|uniref:DUF2811 domain-containing protein n=1 Tax=Thalassoporum mexicanum TaxID=3457544 RepID=UPI00029FE316|nr:DUF2811 domain-containing protein [Pseudanabaena sp. PCC 7367]AFY69783.1 hypothetical protein Pse7367_1494 [Pseudanabaena sp. PCC 7367]